MKGMKLVGEIITWRKSQDRQGITKIYTFIFFLSLFIWPGSVVIYLGTSSACFGIIMLLVSTFDLINVHKDFVGFSTSLFTHFPKSSVRLELLILGVRLLRRLGRLYSLYVNKPFS